MISYDQFFSRVLSEVPGCPEIAATQALRDAAVQFCEQSLIWQTDHDPVSVIAKVPDYDLETPVTQSRIVKIMKLWYMGTPLDPSDPDRVNDPSIYNQSIGGYTTQYSTPRTYIQKSYDSFSLYPIPDKSLANAVTLRIALCPVRDADQVPDFLYEQWVEVISSGATCRLQSSQNKSYYNPQLAQLFSAEFMRGINDARQKATRGYTRANLSVQLRRI